MNAISGNRSKISLAVLVLLGVVAVTLFAHWEIAAEDWGYWMFARILAETGQFNTPDRGPLYVIYLNLFRWLGYPLCVTIEYITTLMIAVVSLIFFLRRCMGIKWAVLAVILWIPYLQEASPHVQNLGLAFTCIAFLIRDRAKPGRFRLSLSYALLFCAYLLRSTYMIFVMIFAAWDAAIMLKNRGLKGLAKSLKPRPADWPLLFVLVLAAWIFLMQSPSKYNNAWFADTRWFPANSKKLSDSVFIQNYNAQYIHHKYGTAEGRDFYFTNKELFGGAKGIVDAVRANPRFVAEQLVRNAGLSVALVAHATMLPSIYKAIPRESILYAPVSGLLILSFMLALLYGALRSCKTGTMTVFILANILVYCATILVVPKSRYLHSMIPVLILGAFWCAKAVRAKHSFIIIPLFLILASSGVNDWSIIAADIAGDAASHDMRILETRPYSLKESFGSIKPIVQRYRGMMSLEQNFIGAFTNVPLSENYDIWEIPPFGRLGGPDYDGLRPDRIGCLLISDKLVSETGSATNSRIRYENYIKPYAEKLLDQGGVAYNIEGYGRAVFMKDRN